MNLLAGDLGGTKTLLAVYKWEKRPKKVFQKKYNSKEWESFESIIKDFMNSIPNELDWPVFGCIGVAGIISDNCIRITNLNWKINLDQIRQISNLKELEVINDFSSLIHGVNHLNEDQFLRIQQNTNPIKSNQEGVIAIIGAGTGLGMARGLRTKDSIEVLPSEGGHKEFAPSSQEEWELAQWLKKDLRIDRLSLERVVSGTGLGHIVRWRLLQSDAKLHPLRDLADKTKSSTSEGINFAAEASKRAGEGDMILEEALRIWIKAYGSASGDFALHELCTQGLWIAGGPAAKNINLINSKVFLNAFCNKGRFTSFLKKIPISVIKDETIGLFSTACRAHHNAESNGTIN